ncbi:DeoR family transcriptional regulator [Roseovarius sp. Pro17]|uniref:DeoR family transcriptional regulator n=1 Tax=Roseovarius sp. Pro17 TaxID=3108175 RepID=UPI002D764F9B|nr:DeoR family transcriptional regulator [Roseovarius sp. Pro17]
MVHLNSHLRDHILHNFNTRGRISDTAIVTEVNVSDETVHCNLKNFETEGALRRAHGAVIQDVQRTDFQLA